MTGLRYQPGRGWKSQFCSRVHLLGRDVPGKPVAVDRTCGPGGEGQAGLGERSRLAQLWNLGIHHGGPGTARRRGVWTWKHLGILLGAEGQAVQGAGLQVCEVNSRGRSWMRPGAGRDMGTCVGGAQPPLLLFTWCRNLGMPLLAMEKMQRRERWQGMETGMEAGIQDFLGWLGSEAWDTTARVRLGLPRVFCFLTCAVEIGINRPESA